jgi:hypothetical protein
MSILDLMALKREQMGQRTDLSNKGLEGIRGAALSLDAMMKEEDKRKREIAKQQFDQELDIRKQNETERSNLMSEKDKAEQNALAKNTLGLNQTKHSYDVAKDAIDRQDAQTKIERARGADIIKSGVLSTNVMEKAPNGIDQDAYILNKVMTQIEQYPEYAKNFKQEDVLAAIKLRQEAIKEAQDQSKLDQVKVNQEWARIKEAKDRASDKAWGTSRERDTDTQLEMRARAWESIIKNVEEHPESLGVMRDASSKLRTLIGERDMDDVRVSVPVAMEFTNYINDKFGTAVSVGEMEQAIKSFANLRDDPDVFLQIARKIASDARYEQQYRREHGGYREPGQPGFPAQSASQASTSKSVKESEKIKTSVTSGSSPEDKALLDALLKSM